MSQRSTGKPCAKVGQQVSTANARYKTPATSISAPHPPTQGKVAPLAGTAKTTFKGGPGPTKNAKTKRNAPISARITGANDMSQLEKFRRSMSKDL